MVQRILSISGLRGVIGDGLDPGFIAQFSMALGTLFEGGLVVSCAGRPLDGAGHQARGPCRFDGLRLPDHRCGHRFHPDLRRAGRSFEGRRRLADHGIA